MTGKIKTMAGRSEVLLTFYVIAILALMLSFITFFGERIILAGTSPDTGRPVSGRELDGFTVTAYCPGSCCNGIWEGKTASGIDLDVYRAMGIAVAAVDPAVIPLGSLIVFDDTLYLSADTGGMIRGRRIDIHMNTHEETVRFGVRHGQTVTIIEQPDGGE